MKTVNYERLLKNDVLKITEEISVNTAEEIARVLEKQPGNGLVAYVWGEPIGVICGETDINSNSMEIYFYVKNKSRNKGVGTALLEYAIKNAACQGIDNLICEVKEDDKIVEYLLKRNFTKSSSLLFMQLKSTFSADNEELDFEEYSDKFYEQFHEAKAEAFFDIRKETGILPAKINPSEAVRQLMKENEKNYFFLRKDNQIIAGGGVRKGLIEDIFVAKKFRGKGLGRKTVKNAIKIASKNNKIIGLTVLSNNEAAVSLYKSLGFETIYTKTIFSFCIKK